MSFLALILMFLDHRSEYLHDLHAKLSVMVFPIQVLVDTPIKVINWVSTGFTLQRQLLEENARLKVQAVFLESKLQKLLTLERENAQLRELLQSTSQATGKVVIAQLLAVDLDPLVQQVILDKGVKDHIYLGQPVLDAYGVLGQVISVGPLTSRVLLINDMQSAVPVQNYRTGSRAIAVGLGYSGKLKLINVPETKDVQEGDLYVASGLGLRFPVGYPVGVVSKLSQELGDRFATILLIPSAHMDKTQQVLLAWPEQASFDMAVQKQLNQSMFGN